MDQMFVFDKKSVARSDKPRHSSLLSSSKCFSIFEQIYLGFTACNFTVLVQSH